MTGLSEERNAALRAQAAALRDMAAALRDVAYELARFNDAASDDDVDA
jgi:hypothetical protein